MTPARLLGAVIAALGVAAGIRTAGAAGGTVVECRHETYVRHIEVVRDPAPDRRCEMRYGGAEEGRSARVVWFSEHDRNFCHDRADNLVAALARRGWVCNVMPRGNVAAGSERTARADPARADPAMAVPRPP